MPINKFKILLILILFCVFMTSCSKQDQKPDEDSESYAMSMEDQSQIPGYAMINIDPDRVQLLGVTKAEVTIRDITKTIRTVGIVEVDERNIAKVQTKFSGWIDELYINFTGIPVKKNEPLFTVYSPDLLSTQEEYVLALKNIKNPIEGRFSEVHFKSNQELLQSVKRRLELWGISSEEILSLEQTQKPTKTLLFRSPVEGVVLSKSGFVGMNVEPGMNIFTIANLSKVWIIADIYEKDIIFVKIGQPVEIKLSSLPGELIQTSVSYVSYVVDNATRTAKVRFDIDNSDENLKPGMYATIEIALNFGNFLAIPDEAIIDTGKRKIVFIAKGQGHFEPREIQVGFKGDEYYQVLSGLVEGEIVVTSAQFLLDSESRLKASVGGLEHERMGKEKKK